MCIQAALEATQGQTGRRVWTAEGLSAGAGGCRYTPGRRLPEQTGVDAHVCAT